jgi:hypothetical protein
MPAVQLKALSGAMTDRVATKQVGFAVSYFVDVPASLDEPLRF